MSFVSAPFSQLNMVRCGTPTLSARAVQVMRSPLNTTVRLFVRLFCWAFIVAHRQFSGSYHFDTSTRSMECFGDGLRPISCKKLSYEFIHLSHTPMPIAPYLPKPSCFGLVHRWIIDAHDMYSPLRGLIFVPESPCVRLVEFLTGRRVFLYAKRHPQLLTPALPVSNRLSTS